MERRPASVLITMRRCPQINCKSGPEIRCAWHQLQKRDAPDMKLIGRVQFHQGMCSVPANCKTHLSPLTQSLTHALGVDKGVKGLLPAKEVF